MAGVGVGVGVAWASAWAAASCCSGGATPVAFIPLQPLVWTHTATLTTWLPKCRLEQPAALSLSRDAAAQDDSVLCVRDTR